MADISPLALSKHFTDLINRAVSFSIMTSALDSKAKQVFGVYTVFPAQTSLVVRADLGLLGSFAGALVGLPDSEVKEHLKTTPIEELLRDAISEVFNVASAVIAAEGRAVFDMMVLDRLFIRGEADKMMKKPFHRSYYNVSVEGYQGGRFSIFS